MGKPDLDYEDAEFEDPSRGGPFGRFVLKYWRITGVGVLGASLVGAALFFGLGRLSAPPPGAKVLATAPLVSPSAAAMPAASSPPPAQAGPVLEASAVVTSGPKPPGIDATRSSPAGSRPRIVAVSTMSSPSANATPSLTSIAQAPRTFRDCAAGCPEMVSIPAGSFQMGSPPGEPGREADEGPRHAVSVDAFAAGRFEITRGEWAYFVAATQHPTPPGDCFTRRTSLWARDGSWRDPGFAQTDRHPVACVSVEDAQAYVAWLSSVTGLAYRLMSEAEWEYAARAKSDSAFWFGAAASPAAANYADARSGGTTPVGSFAPNAFGLNDVAGNLWEVTASCYTTSYTDEYMRTAASQGDQCTTFVLRGGSWGNGADVLRSSYRSALAKGTRFNLVGFRVARSVGAN